MRLAGRLDDPRWLGSALILNARGFSERFVMLKEFRCVQLKPLDDGLMEPLESFNGLMEP